MFAFILLLAGCGGGGSTSGENALPSGAASAVSAHADTGNIVAVGVGNTVTLDGSASTTTSSDPLTYAWSFTNKPDGSAAVLQNATSVNPSFVADVPGTYMVQLVVSAGGVSSQRAISLVEVTTGGNPTGKRIHTSFASQCSTCHDGSLLNDPVIGPVMAKSGNHLATSNMCQACHTTFGFNLIRFVDHKEVFGTCSSCHNGVNAVGKSPLHQETTLECDNCHSTVSFLELGPDGKFDHSNITGNCIECHNGTLAIGKNAGHVVTDSDCVVCHNTVNFKDAFVDHSGFTENTDCASCHNGTDAKAQPAGHPDMTPVKCGVCHGTTTFSRGGVYNHRLVDSSVLPCATCHNDNNSINARGKASAPTPHVTTTADCGVCHGVGGGDFAKNIFDHSPGQIDVNNCSACHGDAAPGAVTKKNSTHMPTSEDCHVCHTPGTFTTGFYDHNGVVNGCNTCHNDVITAGKPVTHIPTTPDNQDCSDCHHSTTTFADVTFTHTGITNNCASCHNGVIGTGKSANHMPTTRDCSDCHLLKFDNFSGGTFDHLGVNNNCADCHNGVIAKGKKVNHIPAQTECSQCHIDTTSFASSIFLSNVHPNLVSGCEGCHKAQFFPSTPSLVKGATHLPTDQDCRFCHNQVAFTPSTFSHAGITGNCASCHDGSADNVNVGALGKPSVASGHPDTTDDCGVCHAIGASFKDGVFDHSTITAATRCDSCHGDGVVSPAKKKNVGHVPTTEDCRVCHVPGTFANAVFNHQGIVDNCSQCHDGSVATATVKSANHIPTTKDCSVCHNTTAFAGAKFDHTGVVDNCASCHDGVIAMGKPSNHVPTNEDCSVCHYTTGFLPATFDHAGIVDNCQSCHDGVFAKGKSVNHIPTTDDCGVCHNTTGFIPATFDHSTVTAATRCDSCHDGVKAIGMDSKTNPPHIATTRDCRDCHTTATFVGGIWVHDSTSVGICNTCHSINGGATPQPTTGHFDTTQQCDTCHTTTGWAPATFNHCANKTTSKTGTCSGSNYPGNHRKTLACTTCHGGNNSVPTYTTPFDTATPPNDLTPYCAACHRNNFRKTGDHIGGSSGTVFQNRDCSGGGSGCHKVTSSSFG